MKWTNYIIKMTPLHTACYSADRGKEKDKERMEQNLKKQEAKEE